MVVTWLLGRGGASYTTPRTTFFWASGTSYEVFLGGKRYLLRNSYYGPGMKTVQVMKKTK